MYKEWVYPCGHVFGVNGRELLLGSTKFLFTDYKFHTKTPQESSRRHSTILHPNKFYFFT